MAGSVTARKLRHRPRAVEVGRLVQLLRHLGQPRQQEERHERRRLPDLRQRDGGERRAPRAEPGELPEAEPAVHEPGVEGEGVAPGEAGHHRDEPVRDEHGGPHQAPPDDRALHDERERHPEHELHGHRHHGEQGGRRDVVPPERVRQHDLVVAQPDPLAPGGVGEAPAVEREPERAQHRPGRDAQHHGEGRTGERPGQPPLTRLARGFHRRTRSCSTSERRRAAAAGVRSGSTSRGGWKARTTDALTSV